MNIKTPEEIRIMREAGRIAAAALRAAADAVRPGISTLEIDAAAHRAIMERDASPTFVGYEVPGKPPYRHATCISVNEEVVHGIPSRDRIIAEGDIVSIDVGATFRGFVGDCALTVACGEVRPRVRRLIEATKEALDEAVKVMRPGARIRDIGRAVQGHAESFGFGVVRQYCGHGIGRRMHEEPRVPNFVDPRTPEHDIILRAGMVLAVEPMLTEGMHKTRELADGWTVVTLDRKPAAHWEHTIAVTEDGPEVLTEAA